MKELVVISGKGGTGKTSMVASFAALAGRLVLADCDVDAADLHLVLEPEIIEQEDFSGGSRARIITEKCSACGKCREVCRFNAISFDGRENHMVEKTCQVDPIACEGCGVCKYFCPENAIDFSRAVNGEWYVSNTRTGPMVHAKLGIAEENSGKLVSLVRTQAKKIAQEQKHAIVLIDGSPGIGCPVIASITGADLVLVVTEPTLSGLHDLERVADLTKHFNIKTLVCINKWDLNQELSQKIEDMAKQKNLTMAGKIRYDQLVTKAQIKKQAVVEYTQAGIAKDIVEVWTKVNDILGCKREDDER
ncbi:ATP-binding protein [bacterium]|nr:ATP-binding protein [bacterium]